MRKIKKVSDYQKEYDAMVKVAKSSIAHGVELSPAFESELTNLMRLLKSMGGKV
jgi:hypothetical protein